MKVIVAFFKSLFNACPYTMAGKKCVEVAIGKNVSQKHGSKYEQGKVGLKLGRNIALMGFFCPIFWVSLFSGADKDTLVFNAWHSGVVLMLGVIVMLFNAWKIKQIKD